MSKVSLVRWFLVMAMVMMASVSAESYKYHLSLSYKGPLFSGMYFDVTASVGKVNESFVDTPFQVTCKGERCHAIFNTTTDVLYSGNFTADKPSSNISLATHEPGSVTLVLMVGSKSASPEDHIQVDIAYSSVLYYLSITIGWGYFLAWSVSFYPQVYINFRRKSVEGLTMEFVTMNCVGFTLYSIYNLLMMFHKETQMEYFKDHPLSVIPVDANDLFFSLHALAISIITFMQCLYYPGGTHSLVITTLETALLGFTLPCTLLVITGSQTSYSLIPVLTWGKLLISFCKYLPQMWSNHVRRSTVGWSIGNIALDFTGGALSMSQLALNSFMYQDWSSFTGNLTKLGLGILSMAFDCIFIAQHIIFGRRTRTTQSTDLLIQ